MAAERFLVARQSPIDGGWVSGLASHPSLHTPRFTPLASHPSLYTPRFTPLPRHAQVCKGEADLYSRYHASLVAVAALLDHTYAAFAHAPRTMLLATWAAAQPSPAQYSPALLPFHPFTRCIRFLNWPFYIHSYAAHGPAFPGASLVMPSWMQGAMEVCLSTPARPPLPAPPRRVDACIRGDRRAHRAAHSYPASYHSPHAIPSSPPLLTACPFTSIFAFTGA